MLYHVALFAWKDSVQEKEVAGILADVRALGAKVPSSRSVKAGENVKPKLAGGFTHAMIATFDDLDGLTAWGRDPEHDAVSVRLHAAIDKLLVVDFEA